MFESVTYVPGMKCYPSVRQGKMRSGQGNFVSSSTRRMATSILHQAVGATSKRVFRGISRAMWTPRGHSIVRSWPDRIDRQAGTENVRPACLKCVPRSSQLDADLTAVAAFSISAATACGCETYTA